MFKILNTPSLFFQSELFREGRFALRRDLRLETIRWRERRRLPWTFSDLLRFFKEARRKRKNNKNVNGEQEKGAWAKRMRHRQGVLSPSYLEFGPNFLWLITKKEVNCCSCEPLGEGEVVVRMSQLKLLFLCCLFILQLCEWSNT